MDNIPSPKDLFAAIRDNDVQRLKSLCDGVTLTTFSDKNGCFHRLSKALDEEIGPEILQVLIDSGVDAHSLPRRKSYKGPLTAAVRSQKPGCLKYLLEQGVDPNNGIENQRITLAAVHYEMKPDVQISLLKLLVQYGVDINFQFDWFGDPNNLVTVLDHATDPKVKAYLRSVGAKTAAELSGKAKEVPAARKDPLLNEVHRYMADKFGPPEEKSFTDMLNVDSGVMVQVIKPARRGDPLTLFTTGLSAKPMKVPSELAELTGGQNEVFGELYMQLPGNWKFTRSGSKWTWPMQHLSNLAAYPHSNDAFFAFVTTIDNDDPPRPLGPKVPFNATMLIVDDDFVRSDGKPVYFYSVVPIYSSESALGRTNINQLLDVMEANNVSRVLDLKRKPFV